MLSSRSRILTNSSVKYGTLLSKNWLSTTLVNFKIEEYKLVIVGGGSGGVSAAAKFASKVGKNQLALVEPRETHYYQPLWTLVGAGICDLSESHRPMASLIPQNCNWIKDDVVEINPNRNLIVTRSGRELKYDVLLVSVGLQLYYNKIKGLPQALETAPGLCSNYSAKYVARTYENLKTFTKGNAIFTFPNTPVKCAGAPQKAMYLSEDYFRRHGKKKNANIMFNTALPALFAVPKYAEALKKVVSERNINVNFSTNLIEVKPDSQEAVFEHLDKPGTTSTFKYEMLHVTPPMGLPEIITNGAPDLLDSTGFISVDKSTLQHTKYPNVFAIGDCTNLPTSKTAAAVAGQLGVLRVNLGNYLKNGVLSATYDGYTSCPLVTGKGKCILAEFGYDGKLLETLPINQGKERMVPYYMKRYMPFLYWNFMLKGYWEGPAIVRKILHAGFQ